MDLGPSPLTSSRGDPCASRFLRRFWVRRISLSTTCCSLSFPRLTTSGAAMAPTRHSPRPEAVAPVRKYPSTPGCLVQVEVDKLHAPSDPRASPVRVPPPRIYY